jgi:Protein of unknown function (DUF3429)
MKQRRNAAAGERRRIEVVESSDIPHLDILFGFGPTVPFVAGVALAWWLPQPSRVIALQSVALWGSAILLFLSGVRRGLSFRTEGGPTWPQMATMLALFCLGLGAFAALMIDALIPALIVLLAGYAAIFVLDPIAARRGEAPLYLSRLRRLQIPVVLSALAISIAIAVQS